MIQVERYLNAPYTVFDSEFLDFTKEKLRLMPIVAGLGCSYRCSFCINVVSKRVYRCRSASDIMNEVKNLIKKYNPNTFVFYDEDFFINKRRLFELLDIIESENLHFFWRVWCRTNYFKESYLNPEVLKRMAKCGVTSLVMGAESGSDEMLLYIKKGIKVEDTIRSAIYTRNLNLTPRYSFMIGLPNETPKMLKQTFNLIMKLHKINPNIDIIPLIFRPYPGSPLFYEYINYYNAKLPEKIEDWPDIIGNEGYFIIEKISNRKLPVEKIKNNNFLEMLKWYCFFTVKKPMTKKITKLLKWKIFKFLGLIRFKLFFFYFPFEYYIFNLLREGTPYPKHFYKET